MPIENSKAMKQRQGAIIFIFITILIDILGIGLIIPVLPKLFEEVGGLNASEAAITGGLLTATYGVMQFLFAPIIGGLSDQ